MAKKSSKIKVSVIEPFLADLRKALQKPGLDEAHAVMNQYGINYTTKYTQNRYVLEQIIMGASLPYSTGKRRNFHLNLPIVSL